MSDLSRDARDVIEAAKGGDDPTVADRERVRAAVFAQIGAVGVPLAGSAGGGGAGASTGASSSVAAGMGSGLKLALALAVAGSVGGGGYWLATRGGDEAKVDEAPRAEVAPPRVEPAPQPPAPPNHEENLADEPSEQHVERNVEPPRPRPARRHIRRPRKTQKQPASTTVPNLRAEMALLTKAQTAHKAGDPAAALRFLDAHRHHFPQGVMRLARDGTRILVLCDLGRTADAKSEATRFMKRGSKHPIAVRVRASCAFE